MKGCLASLEKFSPLHYVKGGYAIEGLNTGWILGLFERRDLRLSGEES